MKSYEDIEKLRRRLLEVLVEFGNHHNHKFDGTNLRADQLFYFGLGALSFADKVLELDRPENLLAGVEAMEKDFTGAARTEVAEP
jgi:hypothetical protein